MKLKLTWSSLSLLKNVNFILGIYVIIAIGTGIQQYALGVDHINNYLIFKTSFLNLIHNKDLYVLHPESYDDLYKYSPSFALFMFPFAKLPDLVGIIIWNLVNTLALFFAIRVLHIKEEKKTFIFYFILFELITSIQNLQSNALMAALMLIAFVFFEKRNVFLAALFISLSFYLKIFGLAAALLFLFYPEKGKFILYMLFWTCLLFFIPLFVVSFEQLLQLYKSWFYLLRNDSSHSLNFSVLTLIRSWFNIQLSDLYVLIPGMIVLLIPLLHFNFYKSPQFRLMFLCSVLIWVIIFNHKAESPTFIIAILGAALWYKNIQPSAWDKGLIIFAFVFTSLSSTDLFPKYLRETYILPYVLKALPCILIWMKIQYELIFNPDLIGRKPELT